MKALFSLLSINLSGKVISVALFAALARVFDAEHLAYIGLMPAVSALALVLFSFGVGTLLERDVPKLMVTDLAQADALARTGFWLCTLAIPIMFVTVWGFSEPWKRLFLGDYAVTDVTVRWMALPMGAYMLAQINAWLLLSRGQVSEYGYISIYGDICSKATALGLYLWRPNEMSVFLGLAAGQIPFLALSCWFHRNWLFKSALRPPIPILADSRVFYIESIFNVLQEKGDNLIVSSLLGPTAMARYYVGKSLAGQLTVFLWPLTMIIVPKFAASYARSLKELETLFRDVWSIAPAAYVWLSSCFAAAGPLLLTIVAGREYSDAWQLALILSWLVAAAAISAIGTRVLLIMGTSSERLKVTLAQAGMVLILVLTFRNHLGAEGVATVWLVATILTVALVRFRAGKIGFHWPSSIGLLKSLVLSLPVPLFMLYAVGYDDQTWLSYATACAALSILSLSIIVLLQNSTEEKAALRILPRALHSTYLGIRRLKLRIAR